MLVAAACIALLGPGGTQEEVSHTPRVDVIEIAGTIATEGGGYDHQWTLQFLDQITADPNSLGLVVSIDSSGGSVYAAQELYEKLSTYRQTGRPVYISLQEYGRLRRLLHRHGGAVLSAPRPAPSPAPSGCAWAPIWIIPAIWSSTASGRWISPPGNTRTPAPPTTP